MFADDLFKKLKPIMGEELYPLQAVYMAGDDEDKRNVERVLRVIYSNVITGIHPPQSSISSGKYPLGTVISGAKAMHPFSLRDEDWFHVGIFGQTGRGKTNAMLHLLQTLKEDDFAREIGGHNTYFFDFSFLPGFLGNSFRSNILSNL